MAILIHSTKKRTLAEIDYESASHGLEPPEEARHRRQATETKYEKNATSLPTHNTKFYLLG